MSKKLLSYSLLMLSVVFALVTPPMIKQCCMEVLEIETLFVKAEVGADDCCNEEDNCCQPQFDQIDWQTDALTVSKISFYPDFQRIKHLTLQHNLVLTSQLIGDSHYIYKEYPPGVLPPLFKQNLSFLI